jgi:GTPase
LRWKGPVFAVTAINGEGCRALVYAIQEWLERHPAEPELAGAA